MSESSVEEIVAKWEAEQERAETTPAMWAPQVRALIADWRKRGEALAKAEDDANKRIQVERDQVTHLHSVIAEQDGLSVTQQICFDRVVRERDSASVLLQEALPWVGHMCDDPHLGLRVRILAALTPQRPPQAT